MAGIETVYQDLALSPALSIVENMTIGRQRRKAGFLGNVSFPRSTAPRCAGQRARSSPLSGR